MQGAHRTRQHQTVRKTRKMVKQADQPGMKTSGLETYLPFLVLLALKGLEKGWVYERRLLLLA